MHGSEFIKLFKSHATVKKDQIVHVKEDVTVYAQGDHFKRGFQRALPIDYTYKGRARTIDLNILSVKKDGEPENYRLVKRPNGIAIKIGDPNIFLQPGFYTYTIEYTVDKQLGFFDNFDQFFWNVTGEPKVPIKKAQSTITIPKPLSLTPDDVIVFIGIKGQRNTKAKRNTDYSMNIDNNSVTINTKYPLMPGKELSVATRFKKGFFDPSMGPQPQTALSCFIYNTLWHIVLAVCFVIVFIYYIWVYIARVRPDQDKGTVFPRFDPPQKITPGAARYVYRYGYDSTSFASDIVNLAVKGFITIEYKKVSMWKSVYILTRTDKELDEKKYPEFKEYETFLSHMFTKDRASITLGDKENPDMVAAYTSREQFLDVVYKTPYFRSYGEYILWGILISFVATITSYVFLIRYGREASSIIWILSSAGAYTLINALAIYMFQGYTKTGIALKKAIEGFRMFLTTTETERLKEVGTPPTKTPGLYETYLPYAMALDAEKAWSEKFAPVFDKLSEIDKTYQPQWYAGSSAFDSATFLGFSSSLRSSLSSAIMTSTVAVPSSTHAPGSRSAWGSGGGAGQGGGGGSSGGW
jgi:uncharacterized membrane protein YgcG